MDIKKLKLGQAAIVLGILGLLLIGWNLLVDRETANQERQATIDTKLRELRCLAENIYHEARSESLTGQQAVAWVTLNRSNDPRYPKGVCEVVRQARLDHRGNPIPHQCQFSWYCDGRTDKISSKKDWDRAWTVAESVYENYDRFPDPTMGAVMYHAVYMDSQPSWAASYTKAVRIDNHIFYK
jgi:spore germination cell wall hydrolase CwlJ-like protein